MYLSYTYFFLTLAVWQHFQYVEFRFNLSVFSGIFLAFDFNATPLLCHLLTLSVFKLKTDTFHAIRGLSDRVVESVYNLLRVQLKVIVKTMPQFGRVFFVCFFISKDKRMGHKQRLLTFILHKSKQNSQHEWKLSPASFFYNGNYYIMSAPSGCIVSNLTYLL